MYLMSCQYHMNTCCVLVAGDVLRGIQGGESESDQEWHWHPRTRQHRPARDQRSVTCSKHRLSVVPLSDNLLSCSNRLLQFHGFNSGFALVDSHQCCCCDVL